MLNRSLQLSVASRHEYQLCLRLTLSCSFGLLLQPSARATKVGSPEEHRAAALQRVRAVHQPWWTGVMDRRFVGTFEPLAAWLKSQVSAGGKEFACWTLLLFTLWLIYIALWTGSQLQGSMIF